MASNTAAVLVENLSKCYRIYDHPRDRLLQGLWPGKRRFYKEFWALKPLSFRLERGQTLGVVGRNGSGKSTLLQLICGTLTQTTGRVDTQGRIGALLELGSGFNPEFTGRENIYLNAALLGLKKTETDERLDDILAFADIGSFLDQPVKTYSSGMVVRLAFSVQAHIDPDLLVVDEALAVGDELFQKKCYDHLERLKDKGCSILLVTHSCPQIIQHCDNALLLHQGVARLWGQPSKVTVVYQNLSNSSDEEWDRSLGSTSGQGVIDPAEQLDSLSAEQETESLLPASSVIYPSRGAEITSARIINNAGNVITSMAPGESFKVEFCYRADEDLDEISFGCHIARHTGNRVTGQVFTPKEHGVTRIKAGQTWTISFPFWGGLWPGVYFIGGGLWAPQTKERFIHRVTDYKAFKVVDAAGVYEVGTCNLASSQPEITGLLS
ncbi:ABC transporter ATP-binding protein [Synechococcus sp. Cruz-9H2]|uniref:ABC transporter ATP-binding protein n=1 Tax=unclassified Synechococcus TaxID=2626047 RepID=UPI0020CE58D4|nr:MULTISPECIES: ABC transporter ATP-binding protein [unclassified Synechococcus]MCP9820907.1 ABC transporter ATP-binding protein [Synechococcus sp. Cruz-9H2]MCP9845145.1 ABC transporter ATP-binding protein [Synechococcus sp. Edmonson 11F2]MCP9857315.1 ABC transporter ATP-binding protein [Synechococcus sp. Cruz-9C9]MCP9864558.1 ABC transporter ATP-binding protein [Synechococcus sp. Cruz-7E5]MCP9871827.1 ABC transporter ATP-binding protein [Synechococcus sp. Cruz-7B9]